MHLPQRQLGDPDGSPVRLYSGDTATGDGQTAAARPTKYITQLPEE